MDMVNTGQSRGRGGKGDKEKYRKGDIGWRRLGSDAGWKSVRVRQSRKRMTKQWRGQEHGGHPVTGGRWGSERKSRGKEREECRGETWGDVCYV